MNRRMYREKWKDVLMMGTDRQAERQTDRQTDRQAGRQAGRQEETDRQTDGQTDRQTATVEGSEQHQLALSSRSQYSG